MNVNITWETVFLLVIVPMVTAFGVVIKVTWDRYSKYQLERHKYFYIERKNNVENKLKNFYLPLYVVLKKDSYMWDLARHLINQHYPNLTESIDNDDYIYAFKELLQKPENDHTVSLLQKLDKIMLENHLEALKIINKNAALAELNEYTFHLITDYSKHVIVYKFLRDDKIFEFPKHYGAPYPQRLLHTIETQLLTLQHGYNTLVKSTLSKRKKEMCISSCRSCGFCIDTQCNLHKLKCNCV